MTQTNFESGHDIAFIGRTSRACDKATEKFYSEWRRSGMNSRTMQTVFKAVLGDATTATGSQDLDT